MIQNTISSVVIASLISLNSLGVPVLVDGQPQQTVLSEKSISLDKRWNDKFVNDVFKDNILLNLAYMRGAVAKGSVVNWEDVRKPFTYQFVLQPNETFAFHDNVLPQYKGKVIRTTNAHFNSDEGFKSDGYLIGDGVCHLASIINWPAKEAGLGVYAPTNHDFATINEIPKEFGVAVFSSPGENYTSQMQNLYITNNKNVNITFKFDFDGSNLKVSVLQVN